MPKQENPHREVVNTRSDYILTWLINKSILDPKHTDFDSTAGVIRRHLEGAYYDGYYHALENRDTHI